MRAGAPWRLRFLLEIAVELMQTQLRRVQAPAHASSLEGTVLLLPTKSILLCSTVLQYSSLFKSDLTKDNRLLKTHTYLS